MLIRAAAIAFCLLASQATAQEVVVEIEGGAAAGLADGRVTRADEKALRWYARQGRMERVEAEARRLKRIDPDWTLPADLFEAPQAGPDVQAAWDFVGAQRYAAARAEIARLRESRPDWRPDPGLLEAVDLGEARLRLINADEAGQATLVVRIAQNHPELLTCGTIDVLWRTAAAHAQTRSPDAAADLYDRAIEACADFDLRLATLQKAHGRVLSGRFAAMRKTEIGRSHAPDERRRLETVLSDLEYGDLLRRLPEGELDASEIARVAELARSRRDAGAAASIGWRAHRAGRHAAAIEWFERAAAWSEGPGAGSAREGLVRAQMAAGAWRAALTAGRPFKDSDPGVHAAYVDVERALLAEDGPRDVPEHVLQDVAGHVLQHRDARSAILFGWRRWRNGHVGKARIWFDRALDWGAGEEAAVGAALTAHAQDDGAAVRALAETWTARSERFAEVARPLLSGGTSPAGEALAAGDYAGCLEAAREIPEPDAGDLLTVGWCSLNLERPAEAARAFVRAMDLAEDAARRGDARYGLALARMRQGDDAAVTALLDGPGVNADERRRIREEMANRWLTKAFDAGRWAVVVRLAEMLPDRRGAQMLRGWSLLRMGRPAAALEVFEALDAALSTPKTREGIAVIEEHYM